MSVGGSVDRLVRNHLFLSTLWATIGHLLALFLMSVSFSFRMIDKLSFHNRIVQKSKSCHVKLKRKHAYIHALLLFGNSVWQVQQHWITKKEQKPWELFLVLVLFDLSYTRVQQQMIFLIYIRLKKRENSLQTWHALGMKTLYFQLAKLDNEHCATNIN